MRHLIGWLLRSARPRNRKRQASCVLSFPASSFVPVLACAARRLGRAGPAAMGQECSRLCPGPAKHHERLCQAYCQSQIIQFHQAARRSRLAPGTVRGRHRHTGSLQIGALPYLGGRDFLHSLSASATISRRDGFFIPNWSQLLKTPISFLPSRSDTMSFSIAQAKKAIGQPWCISRCARRRAHCRSSRVVVPPL